MGFGKWLKGATRIRFDNRTLGNLTKNAAVAGGTLLGGPAGYALAGAGSALGQGLLPGSNLRDIAGAGVKGAGTAGALRVGGGLLKNAASSAQNPLAVGTPGAASSASSIPSTLQPPGTLTSALQGAPGAAPAGGLTTALQTSAVPQSGFRSALNTVGNFAKDNTTALSMGLNAASNALTSGSENRMNEAQADLLEQRADETAYDFEQRKRREAALAPLWSNLGSALGSNYDQVAKNPYAVGA